MTRWGGRKTPLLAIILLLALAWGVNAIAAAHPARSTTLPGLTSLLILPTLPSLATPMPTIVPTLTATPRPIAAHKKS